MRPIGIDIYGQGGQHVHVALHSGWNPLTSIKAGVWVWDTSLELWNACPGAGELYLDRIEITFDGPVVFGSNGPFLPRSNWRVDPARPNVLIIGTGHEYLGPRAPLPVRWSYPNRCPASAMYGGVKLTFALSQRTDIFHALASSLTAARDTGMLAPFGARQPDAPGGELVGSLGGWEQDGAGFLLRHDLTMERMAVGRLDPVTGLPIRTSVPEYTTVRGWGKTTQLPEFCAPASASNDARVPLITWAGTCSYRDLMLGVNRSNSCLAYDAQHLERYLVVAKAAVQCGDPQARFDLDMVAADCQAARMDPSALPNGSRGLGWTIDALLHSRPTFAIARNLIERMAHAQTPSGAILRAPYGYSFSPSPWEQSVYIADPMPLDMDADPILERAISCHAAALDSYVTLIQRALAGMPHPVVKYVGVGRHQTEIFQTYQHPCGPPTWEVWLGIGAAAAVDPNGAWWHTYALNNATPGGRSTAKQKQIGTDAHGQPIMVDRSDSERLTELRDILRAEKVGMDQTAVLRCCLESLHLG